ncbi:hypothetical protein P035_02913 [Brucella suis 06-988-1656]|nr:hypothetical protein C050_00183 [Brucella suis 92/63]ENR29326.1 hypothetical protein C978_00188 [Brucella suis 94/11]ENR36565.1 hypothetical protein C977_00188 [Brucella suis F4/06-146]ENR36947.1 hypothetical protein C006_00208 [Brucella suis F5/03-2]ENR44354.1 hypothetical protein C063_00160 [Brucella suis F8/06-2]ENT35990.1 hypothetical protein C039_00184 [Brucella suis 63/261]ENT46434.1 hypothetical protein B969_00546 [Brucella suis F5/05-4]ENT51430.1 hypothetical protein C000_00543 [B
MQHIPSMSAAERAFMFFMNGFNIDAEAAKLEYICRPARAGMVDRGTPCLSRIDETFQCPTVSAFYGDVE